MNTPLLSVDHLVKRYGDATVVNDLSFHIEPGECLGVIGPNGAGKTTTLRMCLGLSQPDGGDIVYFGGQQMPRDALAIKSQLGVVAQMDTLDPDFTSEENLLVFGRYFGLPDATIRERIPKLLEFAALTHKAKAKPGELSGGMKRRLSLARALINHPQLLMLDEPTTGLDPQARHLMWERLQVLLQEGKSILLTTHFMGEAERLCVPLQNGAALQGDRFGPPQIGHVEAGADVADEAVVGVVTRLALFVQPAVLAVVAPQPVFHAVGLARFEGAGEHLGAAFTILRVHIVQPEGVALGGQVAAGEVQPGLVEPVGVLVLIDGPGQGGRKQGVAACHQQLPALHGLRQLLQPLLALLQHRC